MTTNRPQKYSIDIHQPPLSTSQIGVMQGASRYYELPWNDQQLFVGSGHAFVTNIREDLCPSGPYVWNTMGVYELFANLNLNIELLGVALPNQTSSDDRRAFDNSIKAALQDGKVCTIECLDHQIIHGYDDEGFLLTQPWAPTLDATPPRFNFGSYEHFSSGVPICVFAVTCNDNQADPIRHSLKRAVAYGISLWDEPHAHQEDKAYGIGRDAYPNWLKAIKDGFGTQHGAWWNASVWSECKVMAARYFRDLAAKQDLPGNLLIELANSYQSAAEAMMEASKLDQTTSYQSDAVRQAEVSETKAVEQLRELSSLL